MSRLLEARLEGFSWGLIRVGSPGDPIFRGHPADDLFDHEDVDAISLVMASNFPGSLPVYLYGQGWDIDNDVDLEGHASPSEFYIPELVETGCALLVPDGEREVGIKKPAPWKVKCESCSAGNAVGKLNVLPNPFDNEADEGNNDFFLCGVCKMRYVTDELVDFAEKFPQRDHAEIPASLSPLLPHRPNPQGVSSWTVEWSDRVPGGSD